MRAVLLATLAIAACSPAADPAANEAGNAAAASPAPIENSVANGPAADAATNAVMPPFAEVPGAHPTAPEPAPIPAKFRGTWADSKAACADLSHPSRLGISGRTVRFPDYVIFGDSFTFPQPNAFALKGKIESTGASAEAHYSINPAGDILTDEAGGGAVRVRCR